MVDGFDNIVIDLTGFQRDILFALAWFERVDGQSRVYGLELKSLLDEQYDKEVHKGRLYPNLDTLEDKGLVVRERPDNGKSDDLYGLAVRGESTVEEYYDSLSFME